MPLLQNVAPPTSAFAMPLHREEKKKEIQMYLHYFPSCLLRGLPLAPAWGRSTDLPPSERGYKYRKEQATEITHRPHVVAESKGWAEKRMLTGKGQEQTWRRFSKRDSQLELVLPA